MAHTLGVAEGGRRQDQAARQHHPVDQRILMFPLKEVKSGTRFEKAKLPLKGPGPDPDWQRPGSPRTKAWVRETDSLTIRVGIHALTSPIPCVQRPIGLRTAMPYP